MDQPKSHPGRLSGAKSVRRLCAPSSPSSLQSTISIHIHLPLLADITIQTDCANSSSSLSSSSFRLHRVHASLVNKTARSLCALRLSLEFSSSSLLLLSSSVLLPPSPFSPRLAVLLSSPINSICLMSKPMSMSSLPVTPEQDHPMEACEPSFLRPPHRPRESLLRSLRARELGANRGKCPTIVSRQLYRSIHPNSTVHAVDCQFSNLKRFTPCGQVMAIQRNSQWINNTTICPTTGYISTITAGLRSSLWMRCIPRVLCNVAKITSLTHRLDDLCSPTWIDF